jgi:hypothetical protein
MILAWCLIPYDSQVWSIRESLFCRARGSGGTSLDAYLKVRKKIYMIFDPKWSISKNIFIWKYFTCIRYILKNKFFEWGILEGHRVSQSIDHQKTWHKDLRTLIPCGLVHDLYWFEIFKNSWYVYIYEKNKMKNMKNENFQDDVLETYGVS